MNWSLPAESLSLRRIELDPLTVLELPPRDPNDDDDHNDDEDNEEDKDREPPVVREPDPED